MFEATDQPRLFACPPGADYSKMLVEGLRYRLRGQSPDQMARVEILVNTRRTQRRIVDLFEQGPACLLPRIRLLTDLANDPTSETLLPAVSPLRRRLELSQMVAKLLDQEPDLAPRSAIFDLADSLALLLAEMQDEDVSPAAIKALDVTDLSGHWQRSQQFLNIIGQFFGEKSTELPDQEGRLRRVSEKLISKWRDDPPAHPVIIAGSTGSRGTTNLLMQAVANLPQGAVILPGFDFDLPDAVWQHLDDAPEAEDHPQFRLRRIMTALGVSLPDVVPWQVETDQPMRPRNQLISLALRPAPVTSQWLNEGPKLTNLNLATEQMALVEAPSERVEALAIALALKKAASDGKTAALVTPDRLLTRRVRAALDRWRIEPDVSVGEPLDQSAPGRLLRHVSEVICSPLTAESLLILLKHPLVNTGSDMRGQHLIWTRELELKFRSEGPPFPVSADIMNWANTGQGAEDRIVWANWVVQTLFGLNCVDTLGLPDFVEELLTVSNALSSGPLAKNPGALWEDAAGIEALRSITALRAEAEFGGTLSPFDFVNLLRAVLKRGEVRYPVRAHPNIMIWGTLEARVQGADLVILGGLNDGVWPEHAAPDPWLNRDMRRRVGLLLPERRIGLSAHDFQQAVAAKEVILTRSIRNAEAQTVPSRWLNRITNLMAGMSEEGKQALDRIKDRGQDWLDLAAELEAPVPVDAAVRPSPMPPVTSRPTSLSVTAISRLIRDPYAVYARYILKLKPLESIKKEPDAPLRGTLIHSVMEEFVNGYDADATRAEQKAKLLEITDQIFSTFAPWPVARLLWRAKLERISDTFLTGEETRRTMGIPVALEVPGSYLIEDHDFTLTAKADRIDRSLSGEYLIYDYKTGAPPSTDQLRYFDKQLLLEAVMAEAGAFEKLGRSKVEAVAHIGLGSKPDFKPLQLNPEDVATIRRELSELINHYQSPLQGYTSRRAMAKVRFDGDYDHLARFGEWDDTEAPEPVEVGK